MSTAAQIQLTRQHLKAAGLCRDCRQPSEGKTRCRRCQKKKALAGGGLAHWQATQHAFRAHLACERGDRRMSRGGPFEENRRHAYDGSRGLDWALALHNI
jgi:hypothetical protein